MSPTERKQASGISKAIPYPGTPFFEFAKRTNALIASDWKMFDGNEKAIVSYPELSNKELDDLFEVFSRKVSRKKLLHFIFSPAESFSIAFELLKQKGPISLFRTIKTIVSRTI